MEKVAKRVNDKKEPLQDMGHNILPDTMDYRWINDLIPAILIPFTLVTIREKTIFIPTLSIAILLKMFTIYATILPKVISNVNIFDADLRG